MIGALLKRSTEIFLNSNRKSLHKLNFSHHDWLGEMNTHKTMALEEVLDGVLVKEIVLFDAELFKSFQIFGTGGFVAQTFALIYLLF